MTRTTQTQARVSKSRRGLTLIESVVSLSIISVLMLGLSTSVMLGARALPTDTELGALDREVQEICNLLRHDLASCTAITYQVSGNTSRLNLDMISTGISGEHTFVGWEFIGDANMIRRRTNVRSYEIISSTLDKFAISVHDTDTKTHYVHVQLQYNDTIQRLFELHVQTPYGPELK